MNNKDIHELIERFLDAETTLEEEQELYYFFAQEDVPDDLRPYQEMFRDYACMESVEISEGKEDIGVEAEEGMTSEPKIVELKPKINRWKYASIAASIAILFSCGLGFHYYNNNNFAIAYVNGVEIEDDEVALEMGRDAVSDIFSSGEDATDNLYDIFNPE